MENEILCLWIFLGDTVTEDHNQVVDDSLYRLAESLDPITAGKSQFFQTLVLSEDKIWFPLSSYSQPYPQGGWPSF